MPRSKSPSKPKPTQIELKKKAKWGGYIDVQMGRDEREGFTAWLAEGKHDPLEYLTAFVDGDFTYSLLYDEANQAYIARLFWVDPEGKKSYMLTAFHSGTAEATLLLAYKHFVILDEDWLREKDDTYNGMEFG